MRVLFMGTPEFARAALENIVECGFEVAGVVTQPDKPAGRRLILTPPPVKVFALERGLTVYQPQTLKGEEFEKILRETAPDIIVVAAYGKILPGTVLAYPKHGCVNIHASLLPKYRGASPISAAVINGEKTTGITIIQMDEGIDTGDIILKREIPIGEDETFGELYGRMAELGGEAIAEALEQIKTGTAAREKQPEEGAGYAGKLNKEDCELDTCLPVRKIYDKIRGLSPVPAAYTWFDSKKLKIFKAKISSGGTKIELLEVQLEGGKRMSAEDFINGRKNNSYGFGEGSVFKFPDKT